MSGIMIDDILDKKDLQNLIEFQEMIERLDDPDFVKKALSLIVQMFGYQSLSFFHVNKLGDFYKPIHVHFGDKAIQDYTEYYYKKDPFYFKNLDSRYAFREVISLSEMVDNHQFSNSEYKADFFEKYGFENEIALYLKDGNKHIGAMGVMKFKDEGGFTDKDMALLEMISRIIAHRFAQTISHNSSDVLTPDEVLFQDNPVGMIILDEQYRLINYNHMVIKCIGDINFNTFSGPISQGEIDEILNSHRDRSGHVQDYFVIGEYEFRFAKVTPQTEVVSTESTESNKPGYLLYVTPNNSYKVFSKRIEEFGLTKREIEIVKLIGQGLSNNQIGERLFISPRTVRTHIDNIMTKTDSENRTAALHNIGLISEFWDD